MIKMINWVIFFFRIMNVFYDLIFDINSMLTINLPIIAIFRGIFILTYCLNYIKFLDGELKLNGSINFSNKEKIYFIIKNAIIIFLGFLNIYLAVFFSLYSIMCAIIQIKSIGNRLNKPNLEIFGTLLYYIIPIGFILTFLLVDLFSLLPIGLALLTFYYWGQEYAGLSLKKRHNNRFINRIPTWAYYAITIFSIIFCIVFFGGFFLYGFDFLVFSHQFSAYTLYVPLILFLNLPIIIGTRVLYFFTLGQKKGENKDSFSISRNKKIYLIVVNIVIILLGSLFIYAALFFGIYSLLITAKIYNDIKKQEKNTTNKIFEILSYALIPILIIFSIIFYLNIGISGALPFELNIVILQNVLICVFSGLSFPLYLYQKQKFGFFSLSQLKQNVNKRLKTIKKVPKFFHVFIIAFFVIITSFLLIGPMVWGNPMKETYMIPMSDGKSLATDVYYSPLVGKNPAPVILVRTPYGKSDWADDLYVSLYSPQGYHVVIQDFRGCHDSEGDIEYKLFTKAYTDGNNTIDWILNQDWCNGKIASAGASALCINQYYFAGVDDVYRGNNGLRAQSLWFGCPSLLLDAIVEGAYHQSSVEKWIESTKPDNSRYQMDFIFDMLSNPEVGVKSHEYNVTTLDVGLNTFGNVSVRAIHVGGWYDHFLGGTIRGYIGYDDFSKPRAKNHQLMIIGPWTHASVFGGKQGEIDYPWNSNGISLLLDWEQEVFDESLLGKATNIWNENRIAYYVMGDPEDLEANYWKYAKDWPLNYTWNKWYIGEDAVGNNVLVDNDSNLVGEKNYSYIYDPRDPVITMGGNNQPFDTCGPMDQRPVEKEESGTLRDDVIIFKSNILQNPYTLEGDLKAQLLIHSNCTDTDFIVKLCDIYPDGRRMLIIDAALTTRYRINLTSENFLLSNQTYNITVNLIATAYRFDVGHRIGVTITSSNYDRYAINPNTGGNITDHFSEGYIANNTILTGPGKSHILFPELQQ